MIVHQMQPTRTSCGPTCVAMLVGHPVAEVLTVLPGKYSAAKLKKLHRGQRVTTHKMNVSEMWRLLKAYGKTMGVKHDVVYQVANRERPHGLLRLHTKMDSGLYRSNWHWLVIAEQLVHDPNASAPMPAYQWFDDNRHNRVFFYEVD